MRRITIQSSSPRTTAQPGGLRLPLGGDRGQGVFRSIKRVLGFGVSSSRIRLLLRSIHEPRLDDRGILEQARKFSNVAVNGVAETLEAVQADLDVRGQVEVAAFDRHRRSGGDRGSTHRPRGPCDGSGKRYAGPSGGAGASDSPPAFRLSRPEQDLVGRLDRPDRDAGGALEPDEVVLILVQEQAGA